MTIKDRWNAFPLNVRYAVFLVAGLLVSHFLTGCSVVGIKDAEAHEFSKQLEPRRAPAKPKKVMKAEKKEGAIAKEKSEPNKPVAKPAEAAPVKQAPEPVKAIETPAPQPAPVVEPVKPVEVTPEPAKPAEPVKSEGFFEKALDGAVKIINGAPAN